MIGCAFGAVDARTRILGKRDSEVRTVKAIILSCLLVSSGCSFAAFGTMQATQETNPATEKFESDIKAAVMNGSLTIPQVKELKANLETLKNAKAEQQPGAPVDLLTPYNAVTQMKATMASIKEPDRTTLMEDLKAVTAAKKAAAPPPTEPDTPGKKLGKDIFVAVMHGTPTQEQVQTLQQSLNSLQSLKSSGEGKLQELRTLRQAKSQIEQTMQAGSFRPEDRQAVLDDLNNLGPQGGGGFRGRQ